MTKEELRELAEWGARRKVAAIERTLAELQHEFPDIFVTKDRPVLLKAELREAISRNGKVKNLARSSKAKDAWTPERRAAQAELMRKVGGVRGHKRRDKKAKRARKVMAATNKKNKKKPTPNAHGQDWKQRWFDHLAAHGPERVSDSAKALDTSIATLLTSSRSYLKDKVIKKQKPGVYATGPTAPPTPAP